VAGRIFIPIVTAFQSQGIKDAVSQLDKLGGKIKSTSLLGGGLARSLSVGAIGAGAFQFFKGAITEARNYERELKALETIFGSSAPQMQEFAKGAADIGLSTSQAAKASTFLGSVLKQSGMPMEDVIGNTQTLVGLASDLATVYGYDVQEALTGMTALFRGEYDPIEKFGVAMKQVEVNQLLVERGQARLTGQAKLYAQQVARLDLLMQRSADAQGAFARGQGTLFVEQQNLNVAFKNFQAIIAQAVIPPLAKLMGILSDLVTSNQQALVKIFEDLAQFAGEFIDALIKNKDDIGKIVELLGTIFNLAKEGAVFLLKYGKAIFYTVAGFKAAQFVMKAWVALQPILVAATYATEGAMVALGYAADVAKLKVAAATLGLSLIIAGIVQIGLELPGQIKKFEDATTALKEYGKTASDVLFGEGSGNNVFSLQGGNQQLEVLNKELRFLKQVNAEYRMRAILRGRAKDVKEADEAAAAQKQADAVDELLKKLASFKQKMTELLAATVPASLVTRQLGVFEKAVVDAFDAITKQVNEGIADKLITKSAGKALKDYASLVKTQLAQIASQRDKLANKFQLGKALIADTKKAVIEFANLASIMSGVGEEVTRTTSYMVDEFMITTTETVKSLANAETIISKYRDILGQTRAFADNLGKLKAMGISGELYSQILAGGLEQGAAIAESLVAGGKASVDELNGLFGELAAEGGKLGEQAAQVMYGAGVDLSNGLIKGLMSADDKLKLAAEKLAKSFRTAFNGAITGKKVTSGFIAPKVDAEYATNAINSSRAPAPTIINMTVNAGLGTNGASLGKDIVDAIEKYQRGSGRVYMKAY
jgi:hypothetical protein